MIIVSVSFDFVLEDKDDPYDIDHILEQIPSRIENQLNRKPGCLCTHPESDDIIKDINGNTRGRITLT